jgi:hypothetical protein
MASSLATLHSFVVHQATDYLSKALLLPVISYKGAEGVSQPPSPNTRHGYIKTEDAAARKKRRLFYFFAMVD